MKYLIKEITKELSDKIITINFDSIPKEVISISKKAILDGIGVAVAGSNSQTSKILYDFVEGIEGKSTSTIFLKKLKAPPILAALVNGTMMHSLDYDDVNWKGVLHPTTVILPAILSLGEDRNCSGKDILTAYVLGIEAEIKTAIGLSPIHYNKGWHPTSSLGTIGAAIATGKLLKLSKDQLSYSIGIAVSEIAGILANQGTMTKPFHAGKAAFNGMMASLLAEKGLNSKKDILENGFLKVFGDIENNVLEKSINNFGNPYEITSSGITIKKYPCCASIHPAIDCALKIIQENEINLDEINKINCIQHPRRMATINRPTVLSPDEAKFSTQYCIAMAILENKINLNTFSDNRFPLNRNVLDLMCKIEVKGAHCSRNDFKEEVETLATEVKIELKNGENFSSYIKEIETLKPSFSIENDNEIIEKFKDCCNGNLKDESINKIIDSIDSLENVNNILEFMKLF